MEVCVRMGGDRRWSKEWRVNVCEGRRGGGGACVDGRKKAQSGDGGRSV